MSHRFEASQWVPYPVELVFAFFANPANLPHLTPSEREAKIEDSRLVPPPPRPVASDPARRFRSVAAGVGSEMILGFRPIPWLPMRIGWRARITEFVWNSHFCDEQVKGPFHSWLHRHGILAEVRDGVEGTLVSDRVDYALPLGVLGDVANPLFVRGELNKMFAYRQERLPHILAGAARQATQR